MTTKIKSELYQKCVEFVDGKIENAKHAIENAKEAIEDDEKNNSDDSNEVGRAMMQIEVEKYSNQLLESLKLKESLKKIEPNKPSDSITLGSLIKTNNRKFYISVPAGKIVIDNEEYYAVSITSPIIVQFLNKKVGDEIDFNGQKYKILEIV